MARLPAGTITFMLTDMQGSTRAWERQPRAMRTAMARHDAILASRVGDHGGALVEAGREGDSVLAVFSTAGAAAACALDVQKSFTGESWPEGLELRVRVALHTGEAQLREGHYFGPALNRCARMLALCHPGQILLTKATELMLADELPPGAELQDLGQHRLKDLARQEQVFQLNDLASSIEFPLIRSLPHQQTNMPRYLTTFVGRSAELKALRSTLPESRMVTLTGAGGAGKTRLAAELGQACLPHWPGGVWWVDLAPVEDAGQVPGAVIAALQLPGRGPAQEVVTRWLAARKAILVLDNCEHLVAACAQFCQAALELCPELTIIATSREALGVPGEARSDVSSMPSADAVQLFEARARLVLPNFRVTTSNRETVTQVCDRLDGMPLAIELAAARIDALTEQEILSQLSERFRLLKGGSRTGPERQQTMMATIDWSYRLLTEDEARLFCRLSVFRGGFTLESTQAVCADGIAGPVLDLVTGLVRKSMVVAERTEGTRSRYRLLESQLAYAEDRLRESDELELARRRHYEYFREFLAARTTWRTGRSWSVMNIEWADWIAQESANVWAALGWARRNADDLGLSLAADFEIRDFTQARTVLADLLAHSPAQGLPRVRALGSAAYLAKAQGDFDAAIDAAEGSVALARQVGDPFWTAFALLHLGNAHRGRGELAAAAEVLEEAASLLKGSTNRSQLAAIKNSMGLLAIDKGDYLGASHVLAECVAAGRAEGEVRFTAHYLDSLACAQLGLNDHQSAALSWKEALPMGRRINDDLHIIYCLEGLACVAGASGDDERALRLAAAANRVSTERSLKVDRWIERRREDTVIRSRARLGTRKSEEAWEEGRAMSFDQAIDYALGEGEPQSTVGAGPLSRREREIAKLVARGMTNRQIAERLFIAERTVDGHLEHVREKLAVNTRAQIAAWAVQRGLAPGPAPDYRHGPHEAKTRAATSPPDR